MTEDNKARGITPPKGLISWDELEDLKQNYTPKQIEKLFERCMPKLSKNNTFKTPIIYGTAGQ